jgi:hypothetical protein
MRQLTPEGQQMVEAVAQRHGFSVDAATTMLHAVAAGGGGMAQFDHPEFGGMGQWSQGGMTMIGDMFNNALKARVDGLCAELSGLLSRQPMTSYPTGGQSQSQGGFGGGFSNAFTGGADGVSLFVPIAGRGSGGWWPADLGHPSSTGQQNDIRYAVFPAARRLAIDIAGRVSVYDTLDHQIGGVSQQQSSDASLSFTSQYGLVRIAELPVVSGDAEATRTPPAETPIATPSYEAASAPFSPPSPPPPPSPSPTATSPRIEPAEVTTASAAPRPPAAAGGESADDIFAKLERLAGLRDKGILSEEEFAAKKAELLARL